jgi:hypothetical protein
VGATAAADYADAFITGGVAWFGVPSHVMSDRGVQFTFSFWAAIMSNLSISHKLTTAFHPQSNKCSLAISRQFKNSFRARLAGCDWPRHLPWVLLGLRAVPHEDSAVSAEELVFGALLTLPGPLINTTKLPQSSFMQQLQ